jgi:hypothetical protein
VRSSAFGLASLAIIDIWCESEFLGIEKLPFFTRSNYLAVSVIYEAFPYTFFFPGVFSGFQKLSVKCLKSFSKFLSGGMFFNQKVLLKF